ncbi:MAG: hypothetical protein M3P30_08470 [Chloroflexota bacterium]|nr:hypothetical protein [Chloroflexota bacterium]
MRRHLVVFAVLALFLHGCSAKPSTSAPSTQTVTNSAPASSTAVSDPSPGEASDPDTNITPDTTPQVGGGVRCGVERWPVKTLSDGDAGRIDFTPVPATVAQLRALPFPASHPQASRIAPTELTTFSITATVVEFKLEADKDIHVVIADLDDPAQTMIVEFPDAADCSGAVGSAHRVEMEAARAALIAAFGQPSSSSFRRITGTATFTGVGFLDVLHGQTGVAPNGIERHPVLSFSTGTSSALPANNPPPVPPPAGVAFTRGWGRPSRRSRERDRPDVSGCAVLGHLRDAGGDE